MQRSLDAWVAISGVQLVLAPSHLWAEFGGFADWGPGDMALDMCLVFGTSPVVVALVLDYQSVGISGCCAVDNMQCFVQCRTYQVGLP